MANNRDNGNPILDKKLNRAYRKTKIEHWRVIGFFLMLYDGVAVNISFFFSLLLRFDFQFSLIPKSR